VAIFIYFKWNVFGGEGSATKFSFIAIFIIAIITFLFATVAIWCTVVTARNPISGMTIVTLAIAGFSFISLGLVGKPGMAAVLIIGTIVCSGLGAAGQFSTDLKTGYWIGSTPRNQERWKYVGIIFSSLATAAVVILLNKVYGFAADRPTALPAPQANAMAAVVQMVMGDGQIPWLMYGIGAIIAILFEMVGVSPLAVGLGMYLPMHLNTAMLIGGGLSHIISNSGKTKEIGKKRNDKGILIASGFMAGGAIMGVVGAILMYIQQSTGKTFLPDFGMAGDVISGNILSVVMLGVMCIYFIWDTMKVKE
jgi:putative OPT family oligopeptide transporter